jgi:hypothetical protein
MMRGRRFLIVSMNFTTPKDALQKIQIGQSFAEYDLVRDDPNIFVSTPASLVATQSENKKCFFLLDAGIVAKLLSLTVS